VETEVAEAVMLSPLLVVKVLLLALMANGGPILAKRLLGERFAPRLDGGLTFVDGRPLLGASKTVRGVVLAVLGCALLAPLLGYSWLLGATFGAMSMLGDAFSSFVKRRFGVPPSGRFLALDQIPEILLPLWVCRQDLGLDAAAILVLVVLFVGGSLLLSRFMFRIGVKNRPY